MDFYDVLKKVQKKTFYEILQSTQLSDVEDVLSKNSISVADIPILLSDYGFTYLDELQRRAREITRQRFGNCILLYAPLYLSNECVNDCEYCGFRISKQENRRTLTVDEVISEASRLHSLGFKHILLVSGEDRRSVNTGYLREIISILVKSFPSISIEVGPHSKDEYKMLIDAGLDGLTLYQETYDEEVYRTYHKKGPKSNYYRRLVTPEYALEDGIRRLGLGFLMGLNDFRYETFLLALHLDYLQRRYWKTFYSVSFPRIRRSAADFTIPYPVSDEQLIMTICILRVVFEDVGMVLSTREPASLRDRLVGVGITQMSAGSKTNPGGYSLNLSTENQFDVEDQRDLSAVMGVIRKAGYEAVLKDWDLSFINKACDG